MNNTPSNTVNNSVSILGNSGLPKNHHLSKPDFHLMPKSISSFLKKGTGTLGRNKKEKNLQVRKLKKTYPEILELFLIFCSKVRRLKMVAISVTDHAWRLQCRRWLPMLN